MKRYTNREIITALGGLVFLVFGVAVLLHPIEMTYTPPIGGYQAGITDAVQITKSGSRIYGVVSVAMGAGICYLALFAGREK